MFARARPGQWDGDAHGPRPEMAVSMRVPNPSKRCETDRGGRPEKNSTKLLRRILLRRQSVNDRPTQEPDKEQKSMTDDLIFLKAAGCLTLAFLVFMAWRARRNEPEPWPPGGDY